MTSSLGCSPALGFVHVGHERSFVYDIADLYKADVTIPIAFEIAASQTEDLSRSVRLRSRDEFVKIHLLEKMVHDIKHLLNPENYEENKEVMYLWDEKSGTVDYGRQYYQED